MEIVVSGVKPYDGTYLLDFGEELTTREFGWIKRLSGYLPLQIEDAVTGADPEFFCALTVIALRRAGRIDTRDVPSVYERFVDAPFGSAIQVNVDDSDLELDEGDDADPPENSNANGNTSGPDSPTSSETSDPPTLDGFGTRVSGSSRSDRPTSVN